MHAVRRLGQTLRQRRLDGLLVSEAIYSAGCVLPEHEHARPFLGVVLEGGFVRRTRRTEHAHDVQSLSCVPAGMRHSEIIHPAKVTTCLSVEIGPRWEDHLGPGAELPDEPVSWSSVEGRAWAWRLRQELDADDAYSGLAIEGLVLEAVAW